MAGVQWACITNRVNSRRLSCRLSTALSEHSENRLNAESDRHWHPGVFLEYMKHQVKMVHRGIELAEETVTYFID